MGVGVGTEHQSGLLQIYKAVWWNSDEYLKSIFLSFSSLFYEGNDNEEKFTLPTHEWITKKGLWGIYDNNCHEHNSTVCRVW